MKFIFAERLSNTLLEASIQTAKVCPKAPGGAQKHVDALMGYLLWGVGILFVVAVIVSVGAAVGAVVFRIPHAGRAAVVGGVGVFVAVIAYFVGPDIIQSMLGTGCITT